MGLAWLWSFVVTQPTVWAQARLPLLAEEVQRVARKGDQRLETAEAVRTAAAALLKEGTTVSRFAQLGRFDGDRLVPTGRVVAVAAGTEWPLETVTSYLVVRRGGGLPVALVATPVSESGDWHNEYIHYFNDRGRTVAFERYSGFFNGCPGGLGKERSVTYYTPAGQIVARAVVELS